MRDVHPNLLSSQIFMKTALQFFSLSLLLLLVSCATSHDENSVVSPLEPMLIGRWQEVGSAEIGVFHQNRTVELGTDKQPVFGTFEFIGPSKLKIELLVAGGNTIRPRIYDLTIANDVMTWNSTDGTTTEFRRVR